MAAAWIVAPKPHRSLLLACAVAGAIPDVDLFLPVAHRGPLHSIAAAALVGLAALAAARLVRSPLDQPRIALALGAAYGSHVLLDWLGADTSTPRGLMALWPITRDYFIADVSLFRAISRRYWLESFWRDNTLAVLQELAILGPIVAATAWRRRAPSRR